MVTRKNDEAVSPVIGVILMVAITVILAAVIAAFVFGMSGNISKTKVVAATVSQPDSSRIIVTYNGGQDAPTVATLKATVDGATSWSPAWGGWFNASANPSSLSVGCSTIAMTTGSFGGQDHVVVTGYFTDGSVQVILDTYV